MPLDQAAILRSLIGALNVTALVALEIEWAEHLGEVAPLAEVLAHRIRGEVASGPGGHAAGSSVVLGEGPPMAGGRTGLLRELSPGPLAPEARIMPLDQTAS